MSCSRAVAVSERRSSIVPRSGWIASWPPVASPIAHGRAGIVRGWRSARCCGPCGWSARSGGSAAGRRRRSRARRAAAAGARRPAARPRSAGTAHTRRRTAPAAGRPRSSSGSSSETRPWRCWSRSTAANSSSPSADVVLGALGHGGILELARARARSAASTAVECAFCGRLLEQHDPLGQLARQIVLAGLHLALPARRARCRTGRSRPRSCTASARGGRRRTRRPSGRRRGGRRSGASRPRATLRRRARGSGPRADQLVAVAEDVGLRPSPGRRRSAWPDSGRRRPTGAGTGSRSGAPARVGSGRRVAAGARRARLSGARARAHHSEGIHLAHRVNTRR